MDLLQDKLKRFESNSWRSSSARQLEATLCQLEILKAESVNVEEIESVEARLRYYLPKPEHRKSAFLSRSLPFIRARQLISQFL